MEEPSVMDHVAVRAAGPGGHRPPRSGLDGKSSPYWASARLRALTLTISFALAACLALWLSASAHAEFGFAPINGNPEAVAAAPAFPTDTAVWAGTCDLGSADTSNGGAATAPSIRGHCIDIGKFTHDGNGLNPWLSGEEPTWRLSPSTQAGAHPDASAAFFFAKSAVAPGSVPDGYVKDIVVRLPPGVVGSPTALPRCPAAEAQFLPPTCPANTQAGIATLDLAGFSGGEKTLPVYNIEARDTVTAEFTIGNVAGLFNVPVTARGRTNGDYGVDTLVLKIPVATPLDGQAFTFWGVPWAAEHDKWRINGDRFNSLFQAIPVGGLEPSDQEPYEPSWGPIEPFFTNPTRCQPSPLAVGFDVDSWDNPGALLPDGSPDTSDPNWKVADVEQPLVSGCEKLRFEPTISLQPTVHYADSPTGLDVTLETPQNNELPFPPPAEGASRAEVEQYVKEATEYWTENEAGLATAHLKDTTVTLPAGLGLTPAAANGLGACTTAEVGLTTTEGEDPAPIRFDNSWPLGCPDSSKVGTLKITTPLLPEPLEGTVYLAAQNDNPFHSLFAIYLVAHSDARGLTAKLAGEVKADPVTGQLTTTFKNNPQLPLEKIELHFESGPNAPLSTPQTCGTYTTNASLSSWARPEEAVPLKSSFTVNQGPNGSACASSEAEEPNRPSFAAGTTNPSAGAYGPFVLELSREDGSQRLKGLNVTLPPGLSGKLAGVPYCPEAAIAQAKSREGKPGEGAIEQASPSCPAASQVGTVNVGAGPGPDPFYAQGKAYLAGPYKGAPLSLVIVTPAVAGPFDLGNVLVRAALFVNPETAQIHVVSDPIPTILQGIPLDVRSIAVNVSRPEFTLNPTDCEAMSIGGEAISVLNQIAPLSNRFQVGGCRGLAFKPKLYARLFGKTHRGAHPRFRAVLTMPKGGANIARAAVTLPHSEFLDQGHIKTVCTRVQFAEGAVPGEKCPAGSVYGHAKAITPLLDQPLEGPVYLRSSSHELPDLVAALRGPASQPIEIDLDGRIDSVRGGIRNSFELVPDAPVSKFILEMKGGAKGLLVNSTNICKGRHAVVAKFDGQNGKVSDTEPALKVKCSKKHKRGKHRKRTAGG